MARVLPAGFPRSYYLIYSVSFNPKNMKKKVSESSSLALHDPTQKSIYSMLCNMGDVTQILFCMFNHKAHDLVTVPHYICKNRLTKTPLRVEEPMSAGGA